MAAHRDTPAPAGSGAGVLVTLRESPRPVKALLVGVFVNRLGAFLQIYLVLFLTTRGFSELQAGSTLGVFGVGSVVGVMVGGELADRLGVRRAILLSTVGTAAFLVAVLYVRSYSLLLPSVAMIGVFSRIYRPAAAAMIAELTPQHRRVMIFAIQRFALNLGTTLSPLVGAALLFVSYDLLLWSQAAVALAFALIAVLVLPARSPRPSHPLESATGRTAGRADHPVPSRRASYLAVVADRPFVLFLAAFFLNSAVYLQYVSVLPLAMRDAGLGPAWFSAMIALNGFVVIAFELLGTKVVQRWPLRMVGAVGFAVLGIGLVVQAVPIGAAAFVVGTLIWSLAEIIAGPTMYSYPAVVAPDGLRGRYIGMGQAVFGIGTAVGPVLGVMAWNLVGSGVWLCYGLACALGAILVWVGMPPGRMLPPEGRRPPDGAARNPVGAFAGRLRRTNSKPHPATR